MKQEMLVLKILLPISWSFNDNTRFTTNVIINLLKFNFLTLFLNITKQINLIILLCVVTYITLNELKKKIYYRKLYCNLILK